MRQHDYRRAVGSIRWSPEKRRAIEQELRRPVRLRSKKIKEVERILERHPVLYKEQEEFMKKERRQARIYLYILAAAILAIGGTAAGVAYSVKHKTAENSLPEVPLTEEELANAVIAPKLTDQQDTPDVHGLSMTDGGFFFSGQESAENYSGSAIRYYDEESGGTVYLCAKPNCLHDGSDFCTATTENYWLRSDPVYLDGYVYAVALDSREVRSNPTDCDEFPTVLLRYSADGTEITPVAQIHMNDQQYDMQANLIAHRGQLWITCAYSQYIFSYDSAMEVTDHQEYGGYEIFCYEPDAQKLTLLDDNGEFQKDYRPFQFPSFKLANMKGYGDYVYFFKQKADWRDKTKGSGVFRIDCRTGLITQVIDVPSEKGHYYTFSGNRILYTVNRNRNTVFHSYDLETDEDTEMFTLEQIVQSVKPEYVYDSSKDNLSQLSTNGFFADNTYINVLWYFFDEDERDKYKDTDENYFPGFMLTVLDTEGNIVKTVNLNDAEGVERPRELLEIMVEKHPYMISAERPLTAEDKKEFLSYTEDRLENYPDFILYYDGAFYLQSEYVKYRLTVEDILHGSLRPEPLYIFNNYK